MSQPATSQNDVPDIDNIKWVEHKTKSGDTYRVGTKATATKQGQEENDIPESKHDFDIAVNWPVGNSDWKQPTADVQSTAAITGYKLYFQEKSAFSYILYFSNTEHYDYIFFDKTGDSYECDTYVNDDHYVQYNSSNPDIVRITGS